MHKKAMSNFSTATILVLGLLLFVHLVQARHEPAGPSRESFTHQQEGAQVEEESANEGCGVGVEEEECLMRRTLVAHTDYIYTQGKKH